MSSFLQNVRAWQRSLGVEDDGIVGPITIKAAIRHHNDSCGIEGDFENEQEPHSDLDERTLANISTLDAMVQHNFRKFARLAKATAATMGCDYVMISGHRTWAEQDKLYAKGRTIKGENPTKRKPMGNTVTKARGGSSNHNFGVAGDFGVFRGRSYLDGGTNNQKSLAAKVHKAVSMHASDCGLEWGGSWKGFTDLPHFEFFTGLSMAQKRSRYEKEGSIV